MKIYDYKMKHAADDGSLGSGNGDEDDYLSRLAKSVLGGKEKKSGAVPPTVSRVGIPDPRTPTGRVSVSADPRTPSTPSGESRDSRVFIPSGHPSHRSSSAEVSPAMRRAVVGLGDWVREVDTVDNDGRLMPGVIFVLEDGSMGVYKERNELKDYDIVYMLKQTGRAAPQGIPLANYDVEAVGRLSATSLDYLTSTGRWDRDMIVFHLLKYKDRVHIPEISMHAPISEVPIPGTQEATVSSWTIKKPAAADLQSPMEEKPALTRGRELTIQFGSHQRWSAVYWGKDEMGHVVAHKTHEKWTLMHLDLNRFKDTLQFDELVPASTLTEMERDFAKT